MSVQASDLLIRIASLILKPGGMLGWHTMQNQMGIRKEAGTYLAQVTNPIILSRQSA